MRSVYKEDQSRLIRKGNQGIDITVGCSRESTKVLNEKGVKPCDWYS